MSENQNIERTKNEKVKNAFRIIGNVAFILVVILAFFVVVVTVTAKKDADGTATVFGKQLRFVKSASMEKSEYTDVSAYKIKSIPVKSCVFIEVVPDDPEAQAKWYDELRVGDVLTFKYIYSRQETITHRIVKIEPKTSGGYIITLEGDNKSDDTIVGSQIIDTTTSSEGLSSNYIIGKVVGQSYLLGLTVYAFGTPVGIICLIIVPCLIIIVFQVMRIVKAVNAEKADKTAKEQSEKDKELEELRKRLAMLEGNATEGEAVVTDNDKAVDDKTE